MPHVTKQGSIVDQGGYKNAASEPRPEAAAALKKSLRGMDLTEQEEALAAEAEESEGRGTTAERPGGAARESQDARGAKKAPPVEAEAAKPVEDQKKPQKSLGKQDGHKDR